MSDDTVHKALCTHEPNMAAKFYHPKGWRAPCIHCGAVLIIQPVLTLDPKRKLRIHMSKKERIKVRKGELTAQEVVERHRGKAETTAPKVRITKYIKKGRKK
jgi:hypothetical protein